MIEAVKEGTEEKKVQTVYIDLKPKVITKQAECPICKGRKRKKQTSVSVEVETSPKFCEKESVEVKGDKVEEGSYINLKLEAGTVDAGASHKICEESKLEMHKKRKSKSPIKRGMGKRIASKSSLLDQISEEDEEEMIKKHNLSQEEKILLQKYESRFSSSKGGDISSGGTYASKVSFAKVFSTPRVGRENREFETFYHQTKQKSTPKQELRMRSFEPVMKKSSSKKKIEPEAPMRVTLHRTGTLNPMSDGFLTQPRYEKDKKGKNEKLSGYVGFSGNTLSFD
ncbi:unnamed protein product [Moneuplotes crassus]|uniref:Uncharacterized protein n=1 Tax=Euplotes crassus TaxID=5936 RepID=A0AAD1XQA7_EUPCR|nr:unnamed protein product [Moneuplotes crassus]